MKKLISITIERRPDYDADLSYLGTFDDNAKSDLAIEHEPNNHCVFHWFNPQPGTCETKEDAQKIYKRMMDYERGEWGMCSVRAVAEVQTSSTDSCWTRHEIASSGLYSIEDDGDGNYFDEIGNDQLAELHGSLKDFGFSDDEINAVEVTKNNS